MTQKQHEIINKILECRKELGIKTLPTARQLSKFGIYSNQLMIVGGLTKVAKITGIPMKGQDYPRGRKSERIQLSAEEIIEKILSYKESVKLDHMPTVLELTEIGITDKDLKLIGGLTRVSKEYGIPLKRKRMAQKKEEAVGQKIRPSKAFEKEREARKQGLHYADLQKEETLRIYGKVDAR